LPISRPSLTKTLLIVGEGKGDSAFVTHLLANRAIEGFEVDEAGGTGHFPEYLKALPGRSGFRDLKGLLVVADCDDSPDDSFTAIRKALKKAGLPFPERHLELGQGQGHTNLVTSIMMLPFAATGPTRGCLETLLFIAASEQHPEIAACVDPTCQCVNTAAWTKPTAIDKFKLRVLIGAAHRDDPNFGLQYALDPGHNLIPLGHPAFTPAADAISAFRAAVLR
jgi:hypothetical protein